MPEQSIAALPSLFGMPLVLAQQEGGEHPRPVMPDEGSAPSGDDGAAGGDAGELADPSASPAPASGGEGSPWVTFLPILVVIVVFYLVLMSGQKKEKKRRQELIASIRKGDRVQTVGGILGTVTEVRDDAVMVKVDENNNTRLKFAKAAIQSIDNEGEAGDRSVEMAES